MKSDKFWLLVVAVLLLAAFLRFHLLGAQSFWNDEGNSARLSERSIALIIEGTASDIHPPLYYLLLRGWRELVGDSEFGLRALSAFAGLLLVLLTTAVARYLTRSRQAALVATLFVAFNPALVYYSQEARMYALLGLLALLSTWLLLRWQERPSPLLAVGYVLTAVAGLYTHYFFPVVLAGHGVWLLRQSWGNWRRLAQWLGLLLAVGLLYAPWLPIFWVQFGDDGVTRPSLWPFWQEAAHWLLWGSTWPLAAWSGLVLLVLLALGGWLSGWRALLPATAVLLPIALMWLTGTTDPAYFKFLVVAVPFVGILFGFIIGAQPVVKRRPLLIGVVSLAAIWFFIANQSIKNMYYDAAYARADYRAMAARIEAEAHPNAAVILNAPNQWEAFTYYFADETAVYPLPKGRSRPQPEAIEAALTPIAAQYDRIYAIFWGEVQRDPERLVERWLDAHAFKATDEWVGDVRFVTYAVPPDAATEMETAVDLPFGDDIVLQGYTLRAADLQPGDIVQMTLFWRAQRPLTGRYKVFLHVLDANGQIVAQRDSEPGGGLALTTTWQPGETVVDNHGVLLPLDLGDGRYTLRLGLYDFFDPTQRLPVVTAEGVSDAVILAEWQLAQP